MSFQRFYEGWLEELRQLVNQLKQSARPPNATDEDDRLLYQLVQKTTTHYADYYRVKSSVAKRDILLVFTAPWATALERSLHWVAGWRPTTAFHLIYTEASMRFESQIMDILRGFRHGDLGDLSPAQFRRISDLQCETVRQENSITDQLSQWQDEASGFQEMRGGVDGKLQRLVRVVERADELRLQTIKGLVEQLTPGQAAEFLIAAAHLQMGVQAWGLEYDRRRFSSS